jgi:hypothetical protein
LALQQLEDGLMSLLYSSHLGGEIHGSAIT